MERLLSFLRRLEEASIHYSLASYRDTVMVHVTASASERWEVEFYADGRAEVERFVSVGDVVDADDALLATLFAD